MQPEPNNDDIAKAAHIPSELRKSLENIIGNENYPLAHRAATWLLTHLPSNEDVFSQPSPEEQEKILQQRNKGQSRGSLAIPEYIEGAIGAFQQQIFHLQNNPECAEQFDALKKIANTLSDAVIYIETGTLPQRLKNELETPQVSSHINRLVADRVNGHGTNGHSKK